MKFPDLEYLINRITSGDICRTVYFFVYRGLQYCRRGFSDGQTWSIDDTISKFVYPRLKRFRELNNGYPADMTEKEWDDILDKMIVAFGLHSTQWEWNADVEPEEKERRYNLIQEGLELFGKHFMALWW